MLNGTMRLIALAAAVSLAVVAAPIEAKGGKGGSPAGSSREHSVRGYTKKDGTYVAPHHATNPNQSKRDNYSSKANVNPHTGKAGTKDPDKP